MIARWLFLAVLVLALPARAAVTLSNFPPNPGVLPGGGWTFTPGTTFADPTPARAWVNGVYGGVPAAVVTDTFALKGPAGALSVAVSTSATASNIAARLAWIASRTNAVGNAIAVGSLAYDLLASSGVRQGATGAEMDAGAEKTPQSTWKAAFPANSPSAGSAAAAIQAAHTSRASSSFIPLECLPDTLAYSYGGTSASMKCNYRTAAAPNGYIDFFNYGASSVSTLGCSPQIDALTGQSYTPGTYSDGKCITGRYTAATESQVSSRVLPAVQADPSAGAKAVTGAGQSVESSPYSATGPASQIGTPSTTTTTGPTGTTATTKTPTYTYNYAGNTVTYNTTNTTVTNITNNTGGTSTTTTTEQVAPSDTKQLCDAYPDSLACLKPGTPPEAEAVPIQRKTFAITSDSARWHPSAGSCTRGAITLSTGVSINIWKPFCDFFGLIRGVVVGMFGLVGALIFKNGIK